MAQNRRNFLKTVAAGGGGLMVGMTLQPGGRFAQAAPASKVFEPNAFIRISPDNKVVIVVKHAEMGQGVATALPMMVAEELDVAWDQVGFEQAPNLPAYNHTAFGAMITGGSTSVATSYMQMRQAGAAARHMLVEAAAKRWGVSADKLTTVDGYVIDPGSDRRLAYGDLAVEASALEPPKEPKLKDPKDFKIIGKSTHRLDSKSKSTGTAQFGIDVQLPGMLTAVLARPPVFGAAVKSYNADKAKAVKGVVKVVQVPSGVAVVAGDYWTAKTARDLVEVEWDFSKVAKPDSAKMIAAYKDLAKKPGAKAHSQGDAQAVLAKDTQIIEAEYEFPYLAHAPMEPLNCVAHVTKDGCEVWCGTQFQTGDQMAAAQVLGMTPDKIKIHTTMLGGGFGRRANKFGNWVAEAAAVAKAFDVPVKVVWTREDDMRGGFYRPMYLHHVKASVADGKPSAWMHRIVGQSIIKGTAMEPMMLKNGVDPLSVEGIDNLAYDVPNLHVEYHLTEANVPTLWWRSVGHTHTAFVAETIVDELAHLAKADPVQFRLDLLTKDPRHAQVLKLATEKAGWDKPLAKAAGKRRGRGVAVHQSFNSVCAQVAEITLDDSGAVKVDRVVCAIHCGTVINPDTVEAQMQSAIVYGLTAVLYGKITMEDGRVKESNFHDYQALRMDAMPVVEVHIVKSDAPPTGVGEPGTPPIGPAVANAVFQACGVRARKLPFDTDAFKA